MPRDKAATEKMGVALEILDISGNLAKREQTRISEAVEVVELGELDSTFRKSDVVALKAFLSREVDIIRSPYARKAV